MEDFGRFRGSHKIEFATDEKDGITVIVGGNGKGKTTIFNAIKNGMGFEGIEKLEDPLNARSGVEIEGGKITNEKEIELCLFPDKEILVGHPGERIEHITKENVDDLFIDEMSELLGKYGSYKQHLHFGRNGNSIIYLSGDGKKYEPSMFHEELKSMIFWLVLKKRFAPKSFVIADDLFHNVSQMFKERIVRALIETGSQIVLLVSDVQYHAHIPSDVGNAPQKSLKEILTGQMNVKEYNLISVEEGTKIELIC